MTKSKFAVAGVILLCSLAAVSCGSKTRSPLPDTSVPIGSIDVPTNNAVLQGSRIFGGWAAQQSGIQSVGIYMDGQFVTNAELGVKRPDVLKAFPQFQAAMVTGWNIIIDTSKLTPGAHVFTVKIKSNSGAEQDLKVHATVEK